MSIIFLIYAYLAFVKTATILWVVFCIFLVFAFFASLWYFDSYEERTETHKKLYLKFLKSGAIVFALASTLTILLPSKSDIAYMAGGYAAYEIAQSEEAKKIPANTLKAINKFLEGLAD